MENTEMKKNEVLAENSNRQTEFDTTGGKDNGTMSENIPEETRTKKKAYSVQTSIFNTGQAIEFIRPENLIPPAFYPTLECKADDQSLVDSIKQVGIHTPVIVMESKDQKGVYIIIDGCRRIDALKKLKMDFVPCIVQSDTEEVDAAIISFTVNHEKKTYHPIVVASFYQYLNKVHGQSLQRIAEKVGHSNATIHNKMQLLELPKEVQEMIASGDLYETQARALDQLPTEQEQIDMAKLVVSEKVSVTRLKKMIQDQLNNQDDDEGQGEETSESSSHRKPIKPDMDISNLYFADPTEMPEQKDKSIPLSIIDFPRFIVPGATNKDLEARFKNNKEVLAEAARTAMDGGIVVVITPDALAYAPVMEDYKNSTEWFSMSSKIISHMKTSGCYLSSIICWDKIDPVNSSGVMNESCQETIHTEYQFLNQYELILVFRKKGRRSDLDKNIAERSHLTDWEWAEMQGNVWRQETSLCRLGVTGVKLPEKIYYRLVKLYSCEGDSVLIPWVRDGLGLKVTRDLKRNGIGYEPYSTSKKEIMETLGIQSVPKLPAPDDYKPGSGQKLNESVASLADSAIKTKLERRHSIPNLPDAEHEYLEYQPDLPSTPALSANSVTL